MAGEKIIAWTMGPTSRKSEQQWSKGNLGIRIHMSNVRLGEPLTLTHKFSSLYFLSFVNPSVWSCWVLSSLCSVMCSTCWFCHCPLIYLSRILNRFYFLITRLIFVCIYFSRSLGKFIFFSFFLSLLW